MLDQDGRPLRLTWNYTRAEIIADGIIHAIGVSLGIAGAVVLVLLTIHAAGGVQTASALIYGIGLVALLGFSAAYNMWPVCRVGSGFRDLSVDRSNIHAFPSTDED